MRGGYWEPGSFMKCALVRARQIRIRISATARAVFRHTVRPALPHQVPITSSMNSYSFNLDPAAELNCARAQALGRARANGALTSCLVCAITYLAFEAA